MDIKRIQLEHGTCLFTCGIDCADDLANEVPEAQDWRRTQPVVEQVPACCHCAWCGRILDPIPDFCFLHGIDCPDVDPAQKVAVALAARRHRDVLGIAPSARVVNGWITQASTGITDANTLLGF